MSAGAGSLPVLWYGLLGFVLLAYVMLDGYDLGVGMISLFSRSEQDRGICMDSIGPVWDANETWLVMFGGMMFGAFPLAYGLLLSALYIPIAFMLFGLIFRAVSFEFRAESRHKAGWGLAFGLGSLTAVLGQGFFLGGILHGVTAPAPGRPADIWSWVDALPALTTAGLICGYLVSGAGYLRVKGRGGVPALARRAGLAAGIVLAPVGGAAILLSELEFPWLSHGLLAWPGALLTALPLFLTAVCLGLYLLALRRGRTRSPLVWALLLFLFAYTALAFSLYPYLAPPSVRIFEAAGGPTTLRIMLYGAFGIMPLILFYNVYQHRVFRGRAEGGIYGEG